MSAKACGDTPRFRGTVPLTTLAPSCSVLIVTEHQIPAYTANALPYRVQTYNISIEVTEQQE